MQMKSFIYSGDSEAEIIFIEATISNYGYPGGTVRLAQSADIGANVRMLTGALGGVADGATVDAAVGAV